MIPILAEGGIFPIATASRSALVPTQRHLQEAALSFTEG